MIDHYHFGDPMGSGNRFTRARLLIGGLSLRDEQIPIKHIVNKGGFSGTGNAGDACEHAERKIEIDVF